MSQNAVHEETMYLDRQGRRMPVYIASPDAPGRHPGVIVVHEIFGLDEHIKDVARRFARAGLAAYAPDLFAGIPGLPSNRHDLAAMRDIWQKTPDGQFIADMQEVFQLARLSPRILGDKIGAIGYCMGGAMALMLAGSEAKLAWVADYYGRILYPELSDTKPKNPIDYVQNLRCPFLGIFAGDDPLITKEHVQKLEEKLKQTGKPYEVKIYEGAKHAFFNDVREFYDPAAAKDAWQHTLDFIAHSTNEPVVR